jgi:predicted phosphodiesterase
MHEIAVLSDIHSNLTALQAVQRECERRKVKEYYCLGDITGYGPHPAECIAIIRKICSAIVMGNHDEAVAGGGNLEMNWMAKAGIDYSIRHTTHEEREWLAGLPAICIPGRATIVHASFFEPRSWHYAQDARDATELFRGLRTPVCFFGHTHVPALLTARDAPQPERLGRRLKFRMSPQGCTIANPGAVGQPRNGDPRAQFLVFNPDEMTIEYVHVRYAIRREIGAIREAGLPPVLGERLLVGM